MCFSLAKAGENYALKMDEGKEIPTEVAKRMRKKRKVNLER